MPDLPDGGAWQGARRCAVGHDGASDEVLAVPLPACLRAVPLPADEHDRVAEVEVEGIADLSPAEVAALVVLARGGPSGEAARAAGVHRNTVARWVRPGAPLDLALAELRRERVAAARRVLVAAAGAVAGELVGLALDPACPPAVRVRAACAVLDRAGLGPCAEPVAPVVDPVVAELELELVLARAAIGSPATPNS